MDHNRNKKEVNMDIFDQIANAKTSSGGHPYLDGKEAPIGNYLLEIHVFKVKTGQLDGRTKFIGELKIVESDVPSRPAGSYVQFIKDPMKTPKMAEIIMSEVKEFIAATLGEEPKSLQKDDIKEACDEENPLRGKRVRARIVVKDSGFKKLQFLPV